MKSSSSRRLLLAVPLIAAAILALIFALYSPRGLISVMANHPDFEQPFRQHSIPSLLHALRIVLLSLCPLMLAAGAIALLSRPWSPAVLRKGYIVLYCAVAAYVWVMLGAIDAVALRDPQTGTALIDASEELFYKVWLVGPAMIFGLGIAFLHFLSWQPWGQEAFDTGPEHTHTEADRFAYSVTHPAEPIYRSSVGISVALHFLAIFIIPAILTLRGCSDAYLIPGGGGGGGGGGSNGAQGQVVIKLQKSRKQNNRRKRHIGRTNSPISLYFPSIDDSQVNTDVEQVTQEVYKTDPNDVNIGEAGGPLGDGGSGIGHGKGSGSGFEGGMAGGKVRFIRLQYDDSHWNDGMESDTRADMNFLDALHKEGKLDVASQSEAIPVVELRRFKKGLAPPFVYFTGEDGAIRFSDEDVHVLRQYLLDGGMLFADAGSEQWADAFHSFMNRVFPERPLVDIPNDDAIFQRPFQFPDGAPPLWHHDRRSSRAQGIRLDDGRLCVFYYPGNLNDAWKTGSRDTTPPIVAQAEHMGMNVVYYSFVHYIDLTRQYRKK